MSVPHSLNRHRQNSFVAHQSAAEARGEADPQLPAALAQSVPQELLNACARFLQAPR